MGNKDVTEKTLEMYNDVFADIVNVLLFDGNQVIKPDELVDQAPRSHYKADGKIRELERDAVKRWVKNNVRIACIGVENQSETDKYMSIRVFGYDGTEYRAQMIDIDEGKIDGPYPVITLVLYFGYTKHWDQPRTLLETMNVPEELRPYVNDLKINLFEIAWLTHEQVNLFQSDFRIVADYFVQMRENRNYEPSKETLDHINAVLELLNVMDDDHRFESKMNESVRKGEARTMSEWLTKVLDESWNEGHNEGWNEGRNEGWNEGRNEGWNEGCNEGENKAFRLMNSLVSLGRFEDVKKASDDLEYRNKLYQELQIA